MSELRGTAKIPIWIVCTVSVRRIAFDLGPEMYHLSGFLGFQGLACAVFGIS